MGGVGHRAEVGASEAGAAPQLAGRGDALVAVQAVLGQARSAPKALFLEGPPGIGKTAVWREVLRTAGDVTTLRCAPTQAETAMPFAGLADLLAAVPGTTLVRLPEAQRQALEIALCRAVPGPGGLHALAVAHGLLSVLRLLTHDRPVLVAVDDVQWLDRATAQALVFALRRVDARVALLATRRSGEPVDAGEPWGELQVDRLVLPPLGLDEVDEVLRSRLGSALRLPALIAVHRGSGGNPLHAVEIARAALDAGAELHPGLPLPVPPDLASLLRARVARLPARAQATLRLLAGLAHPTLPLLAHAVGEVAADEDLAAAHAAGIVQLDRRPRFTHPLLAAALLDDLDGAACRRLHARLADAVPDEIERARHLALAAEGADRAIAAVVENAASVALLRGAPPEAAALAEQALRLTDALDVAALAARAVRAASLHELAGDFAGAVALLRRVMPGLPPGPHRVPVLVALAVALLSADDDPAAAPRVFAQALDEAGQDATAGAEVRQVLAWELASRGELPAALEHARACARTAGQVEHPRLAAGCLAVAALVDFISGAGGGPEAFDAALALEPDPPASCTWPYPWAMNPTWAAAVRAVWADDAPRALAYQDVLRRSYASSGDVAGLAACDADEALVRLRLGQWEAALAGARTQAAKSGRLDRVNEQPMSLWLLALVEAHVGLLDEARAHAERGLELARHAEWLFVQVQCEAVLGFVALSAGDVAQAWEQLAPLPDRAQAMGLFEPGFQRFTPDAVEAAVTGGHIDHAQRLAVRFAEHADRARSAWGAAAALRCRGLVLAARGDLPGATDVLDRSLALHEGLDQPFELARTLLAAGTVARRRKRKAVSAQHLSHAAEIFRGLPAPVWAARADAEAERLGGRPSSPLVLTATERRVAELAAQGMSNAEAAAALFVSTKTVEWNLSKVYRKTGVRSRAELAARWPLEA